MFPIRGCIRMSETLKPKYFSYFLDPNGNTMEYTTELEVLDEDTWHPHLYDFSEPEVTDQWGTANAMDEFVAAKSFNDVDKGLFVAPPA